MRMRRVLPVSEVSAERRRVLRSGPRSRSSILGISPPNCAPSRNSTPKASAAICSMGGTSPPNRPPDRLESPRNRLSLSRKTRDRVVTSNHRILNVDHESVTFSYRDRTVRVLERLRPRRFLSPAVIDTS